MTNKDDGFWREKKVLITGGSGFLGSYVCSELEEAGCRDIIVPRSSEYDLTREANVIRLFKDNPGTDIVIHLAAVVGGIGANMDNPGSFYYKNLMMGALMMEHARLSNVKKFVALGTICAYPKFTTVPFREEDLWSGYPEETNAPYGIAKKGMLVQSQSYRQQYGFNSIYLLPVNLYGPGDNFNPDSSHVIPALIKKFIDAKKNNTSVVEVWGDGSATREFLYAQDAAKGIVLATEHYDKPHPINLGTGKEITIKELVKTISDLIGFEGTIKWDDSRPNGQPRRCLDVTKAHQEFGFKATTDFKEGLKATITWYKNNAHLIP